VDSEDDLIAADLQRFDPAGAVSLERASVARFVDGDIALTILNVNRKPLEHALGVDLVYWDTVGDVFTLLQYKRLVKSEQAGGGEERWRYTRRQELIEQLALMSVGSHEPSASEDWRLGNPFWFKFLRTDAFVPNDPMVLPGMYVPADYLRLALDDGSLRTGPSGGFEVTYRNTRYLNRRTFVDLVRQRMTGTAGSQSQRVIQAIQERSANHEVVLAVRAST
jgi:hypothetical protein